MSDLQAGLARQINYDGRRFRVVVNSAGGDAQSSTQFSYHQRGSLVWATYEGGDVVFGTLIATVDESGTLDMRYQHLNLAGDFRTGKCRSIPEFLADGRLRLHESWQWTDGDGSAVTSVVEEI
jgi:hypothetical protein